MFGRHIVLDGRDQHIGGAYVVGVNFGFNKVFEHFNNKEAEENKGRIITIQEALNAIRSQRYSEITRVYNENRRRFGVTGEDIIYQTEEVDLNNIVR